MVRVSDRPESDPLVQALDQVLLPLVHRVSLFVSATALLLLLGLPGGASDKLLPGSQSLVILLALLALGFRLLLRFRSQTRLAVTITLLVCALAGLTLETAFQLYPPLRDPRYWQARRRGIAFDTRDKLAVIEDARRFGRDTFPTFSPRYYLGATWEASVVPLGGISRRQVVLGNEGGFWVVYDNDRHGFNNRPGGYDTPVDLALLGDSFTIGAMVERAHNLASLLERPGRRVMNFGRYGIGTFLEWCIFREYVVPLRPRQVLIFVYWDDPLQAWWEEKCSILSPWRNETGSVGLIGRQEEIDRVLEDFFRDHEGELRPTGRNVLARIAATLTLEECRRLLGLIPPPPAMAPPPEEEGGYRLFGELVGRMRDQTAAWGGSLAVVYLPPFYRAVPAPDEVRQRLDRVHAAVCRELQARGISLLDLDDFFRSTVDPLALFPFRRHNHFNAEGYRLIADRVRNWLDSRSAD